MQIGVAYAEFAAIGGIAAPVPVTPQRWHAQAGLLTPTSEGEKTGSFAPGNGSLGDSAIAVR